MSQLDMGPTAPTLPLLKAKKKVTGKSFPFELWSSEKAYRARKKQL